MWSMCAGSDPSPHCSHDYCQRLVEDAPTQGCGLEHGTGLAPTPGSAVGLCGSAANRAGAASGRRAGPGARGGTSLFLRRIYRMLARTSGVSIDPSKSTDASQHMSASSWACARKVQLWQLPFGSCGSYLVAAVAVTLWQPALRGTVWRPALPPQHLCMMNVT